MKRYFNALFESATFSLWQDVWENNFWEERCNWLMVTEVAEYGGLISCFWTYGKNVPYHLVVEMHLSHTNPMTYLF